MRKGSESQTSLGVSALMLAAVAASTMISMYEKGAPWWQLSLVGLMVVGTASYSWTRWQENQELRATYQGRLDELLESTWHAIRFATRDEAIAFVGELTQRLPAPIAEPASYEEDIEVSVRVREEDVTVYLSDGALRAFTPDFPAPQGMRQLQGKSLSQDRVPVLIGAPQKPLIRDEIVRRLEGKHLRGVHVSLRLTRPL